MLSFKSTLAIPRNAALMLFILACGQGTAMADNYVLNTPSDTNDKDLTDSLCADKDNLCSLRAAIQNANKQPGKDTITLGEDTYVIDIPGKTNPDTKMPEDDHSPEKGDVTDDLDIVYDLILSGAGADKSIIETSIGVRILHILSGATVTASGITIQSGSVTTTQTIENGSVTNTQQSGGGILIEESATLDISDCVIRDNVSTYSGGGVSNAGNLTVNRCTFTNNQAPNYFGGAIFNMQTATKLSIDSSTFNNNSADFTSAIYHGGIGSATITNSAIYDNHCTLGFGAISTSWSDSEIFIINSTVSGNTCDVNGAAITASSLNNKVYIINSTVTNNYSKMLGGGISSYGPVILRNSLVANNTNEKGKQDCNGPVTSEGNNILGVNNGCNFSARASDIVGTQANPVNAMLAPLASNGGLTLSHALLAKSPAIDAGNPAVPGSGGLACENFDQRGVNRANNGRICDIGAYELASGADIWVTFTDTIKARANDLQQQNIHLGNNGAENARNVELVIFLPEGSEFQGMIAEEWVCRQSPNNSFTCTIALLDNAKEYDLSIQTLPPVGVTDYTMKALVTSATPDPLSANNEAATTILLNAAPIVTTESNVKLDKPSAAIASKAIITDADDDMLTQASVRFNSSYYRGVDSLSLTGSSSITVQWDEVSGTLELQGNDSLINYQNALRQIMYNNSDPDNYTDSRSLVITVSDSLQASLPVVLSLSPSESYGDDDDDESDNSELDPFADDDTINNVNNTNQHTDTTKSMIEASVDNGTVQDMLLLYITGNKSDEDDITNKSIINGTLLNNSQRDSAWISLDKVLASTQVNSLTSISVGAIVFAGVIGLFGRLGSLLALVFSSPLLVQFDPVPVVLITKKERRRREKEFDDIRSQENTNKGIKALFDKLKR